ncbi:MAG: MFS transporter [Xanthobacteraceae bacterium]|nr:MFS transporter [Xanthobacteraceae bacterium]
MSGADPAARTAALFIAVLQFIFALGWTVYVIYLPQLAARVGLPPGIVVIILMVDQAVFTFTDTLMGIAADRMSAIAGRLSNMVVWLTMISCAAFLLMPFATELGANAKPVFLTLIAVWVVTSSALRAPPLALLGKFAAKPTVPFLAGMSMLGLGLASAISPYLGVVLRNIDPRIPFAVSSVTLLVTALAISSIEHRFRQGRLNPTPPVRMPMPKSRKAVALMLITAVLVLAIGYQFHTGINSAPLFLRFAKQPDLEWLLPVYWIGFSIASWPIGFVTKRLGGILVIGAAGLLGAGAVFATETAASLNAMIAMQFTAGAAWGCIIVSAIAAATALGKQTGHEGTILGLLFSSLALATFTRLAAVAGGLSGVSTYQALLQWMPVVCWAMAGLALLAIAVAELRKQQTAND